MNTGHSAATSARPGLRVADGVYRLQRAVVSVYRALSTLLGSGIQPSRLADLRFPLFTRHDDTRRGCLDRPTHDHHLPPPC